MIRSLWLIVSTVAIANLLALGAFVAWLRTSERLNDRRIQAVREIFRETIPEEAARLAAEEKEREQQAAAEAEKAQLAVPPEPAAVRVARQEEEEQVETQRLLRLQREIDDLRRALDRKQYELEAAEARLKEERAAFEDYRAQLKATEGSEQFRKTLATLQAQRPRDAKAVLAQLWTDGDAEQVVSYLSAMQERARGKVFAEFVKDDPDMAAQLLERLRQRGVSTPAPESPDR